MCIYGPLVAHSHYIKGICGAHMSGRMISVVLSVLAILAQIKAESRRCSAPVICSSNGLASPGWMEVSPDHSCETQGLRMSSTNVTESLSNLTGQLQEANVRTSSLEEDSSQIKREVGIANEKMLKLERIGSMTSPAKSCEEIIGNWTTAYNGQYFIEDSEGNIFLTYCDMMVANGGWTLVASIHENNMKGRCTTGDRWSSEQGNSAAHPHGDGFWENRAIHGAASSATSDDYKSPGYFTMNASDVMIWHVPNDTPLRRFDSASFLKYHTSNEFLQKYGGNLQTLFDKHYPMRSGEYEKYIDNGPAIPIIWDKGSNETLTQLNGPAVRTLFEAGFIQFRAINYEGNAFALCPGARMRPSTVDAEHVCVGSTSNNTGHPYEEEYCGDFAAKDWIHHVGWNASEELIDSVIFIFYR